MAAASSLGDAQWRQTTDVSQKTISATAGGAPAAQGAADHGAHSLGALLCWAVVFADIGTSVYYTPGILFGQFGHLGGFFVALTMGAFVLLALKYAEVSVRFPEGGGVVTVSARALNPWVGALGGMFILVDYFLTAAISSLSGLQYFQDVYPGVKPYVLIITIIVLVLLGVLNWWGIKESAMVSLYIAIAAFVSDIVIIVAVAVTIPFQQITSLFASIFQGERITPIILITGFAGAFLAFSGLESISQLSPVMQRPRSRTVTIARTLVVLTVGFTSPLLTILATTLLDGKHNGLLAHQVAHIDPNQFISQLGLASAGPVVGIATAVIASALLIFASNTAIIGTYHVFLALSRMSFFPAIVEKRDKFRDTPYISIALATGIPIAILIFANGQIDLLGQLYAFGLLGAFSLTCIAVDVLRFRERRGGKQVTLHDEELEMEAAQAARTGAATSGARDFANSGPASPVAEPTATQRAMALWREKWRQYWPTVNFVLGIVTTILVLSAWTTNLISKRDATIFGSSLTVVGMVIAFFHYRYQTREGRAAIQPSWAMSLAPESIFAIVRTGSKFNEQVIRSAFQEARGRLVLLVFLADAQTDQPRFMAIDEQVLRDQEAQDAFRLARQLGGPTTPLYYRIGTVASAAAMWRVARSREVVTDASTSREFVEEIAPVYIRFRRQGEENIAHIIMRKRGDDAIPTPGATPVTPSRDARRETQAALYNDTENVNDEAWVEEFRDFDPRYADPRSPLYRGGSGARGRTGATVVEQESGFIDAQHPDHDHDGDTAPRHHVKIMDIKAPPQPGVIEPSPPSPLPAKPNRTTEPTALETDDDWIFSVDDNPYLGPSQKQNGKTDDDKHRRS